MIRTPWERKQPGSTNRVLLLLIQLRFRLSLNAVWKMSAKFQTKIDDFESNFQDSSRHQFNGKSNGKTSSFQLLKI